MRIVAISDTHGAHETLVLPDGDVLVHAGDFTRHGELAQVVAFDAYLAAQPHRHKLVVAGNHDRCFQARPADARAALRHAVYLEDESATIDGVRFYGSPWQPLSWGAFTLRRGEPLREKWSRIPAGVVVLVTHGPPRGHGDDLGEDERVGCQDLLEAVERRAPRLHVFGHVHQGAGVTTNGVTTFANASICDGQDQPIHAPRVFDL